MLIFIMFIIFAMHLFPETLVKLQFHTDNNIPALKMIREPVAGGGSREQEGEPDRSEPRRRQFFSAIGKQLPACAIRDDDEGALVPRQQEQRNLIRCGGPRPTVAPDEARSISRLVHEKERVGNILIILSIVRRCLNK